jgi:outer membrane receptor for ferrienterochelin and colicin
LPVQTIESLPALLGEADLLKAVQLLPGVQSGMEATSGFYVRGGNADENLILLDGVPVYNATHLFGLFSVFNIDAIQSVTMMKGGFPASYGGRLSGILDVRMKEGNKYETHVEAGIGLITSKLTVEGPLKKGISSYMISGRRTYLDIVALPLLNSAESTDGYRPFGSFFDLNAKVNWKLGDKDHVYLSMYRGRDKMGQREKWESSINGSGAVVQQKTLVAVQWGNITAMGRWNHQFNKKTFGNLTFNFSRYKFDLVNRAESDGNDFKVAEQNYFSNIRDFALRYDLDYLPHPRHFIKFGVSSTMHLFSPGATRFKEEGAGINVDTLLRVTPLSSTEWDAYIEDDLMLADKLKTNIGVHFAGFYVERTFFRSVQPRLSLHYLFNKRWSVKAAYSRMNQYIHLLTNSGIGLPTDLWVPATKKVKPSDAHQWNASIHYEGSKNIELIAEVYYKQMSNVIEYADGSISLAPTTNWQDKLALGKGWAYGTEWSVQKKKGKFTGLASYTLAWAWRQFPDLNFGKRFPFRYDKRHSIKIAGLWRPGKHFELSFDWIFNTGNAVSLPVASYYDQYQSDYIDIYEDRNQYRMHNYHRMDLAFRFMKKKRRHERVWTIGFYNVYSRMNAFYIQRDFDYSQNRWRYYEMALLPILPSFMYQVKF